MWLATNLGYFSIVKKQGQFYVRARCVGDLELLLEATGIKTEILQFAGTDYTARIIINIEQLWKVQDALFDTITYPNFKNSIHDNPAQCEKVPFYNRVWGIMFDYQTTKERVKKVMASKRTAKRKR